MHAVIMLETVAPEVPVGAARVGQLIELADVETDIDPDQSSSMRTSGAFATVVPTGQAAKDGKSKSCVRLSRSVGGA